MAIEHVDVLVIGAGISGICAGYYLQRNCPQKRFIIVEARDRIGGTWDLFRYPGIRSDSDMYSFGYSFRPWTGSGVASGPAILDYLEATVRDEGLTDHLRFGIQVDELSWSSAEGRWQVQAHDVATGAQATYTAQFVLPCTGYYRYDQGYTPVFPGIEAFEGPVVHPQSWPEGLEVAGKRVAVIGSGATTITLVPALVEQGAQVTMIQRTPTYIVGLPQADPAADWLRRRLPARAAYRLIRWRNVGLGMLWYQYCRRFPARARARLRRGAHEAIGDLLDVDVHFNPPYDPWDQRMCLAPDGDFFAALRSGNATVVTDRIDTFTESGIALASGAEVEADVVVTATGLQLQFLGGAAVEVDGRQVDFASLRMYRGTMLSDLPNAAFMMGYTNASWTLKCELAAQYVTRLLNHMDRKGFERVTPRRTDPTVEEQPAIDLTSGYIQRSTADIPTQGSRMPWRVHQNFVLDQWLYRGASIEDGVLAFEP